MSQIFIVGSSSTYGVGGENGGWADLLKQKLHKKMYGKGGIGEKYEIYNFGKSGATIDFVMKTFPQQLEQYGRGKKTITIVSVGGNNAKAEDEPKNYVSTLKEYTDSMSDLLNLLASQSTHVIAVGGGYYDESKTNPKINPFTGGKSFFTNVRRQEFQAQLKKLCIERKITFIETGISESEWKEKYIYDDGLHPGALGHELISEKVMKELEKIL